VDLEHSKLHTEVFKIRIPFFSQEKMIKDFQIKKNQYG
jgi:hypothetical protein